MDLLPTILELAGIPPVVDTFQGREAVPVKGKSWVNHLASKDSEETSVHDKDAHVHGWELIGLCAIRKGKWKAVWMHPPRGKGKWELDQIEEDPAEAQGLSAQYPEKMQDLKECRNDYYTETGMFDCDFVLHIAIA
jgi:arylsulfatase A-like enzyme